MRCRVLREFTWDGIVYQPGNKLEIPDGHPRLDAMVRARSVTYDATLPGADDKHGEPVASRKSRK